MDQVPFGQSTITDGDGFNFHLDPPKSVIFAAPGQHGGAMGHCWGDIFASLCSLELAASFPNAGRLFAEVLGSAADVYPCGLVQVSRCIEAYLQALRENGLKPVLGENKDNAMHRPCKILEGLSPPSRYCAYRRPRAFAAATPN